MAPSNQTNQFPQENSTFRKETRTEEITFSRQNLQKGNDGPQSHDSRNTIIDHNQTPFDNLHFGRKEKSEAAREFNSDLYTEKQPHISPDFNDEVLFCEPQRGTIQGHISLQTDNGKVVSMLSERTQLNKASS